MRRSRSHVSLFLKLVNDISLTMSIFVIASGVHFSRIWFMNYAQSTTTGFAIGSALLTLMWLVLMVFGVSEFLALMHRAREIRHHTKESK
jgi:uncharacterized membrane protein